MQNSNKYFYPYYLAFDLYDMIDELKEIVNKKMDCEMDLFNVLNISTDGLSDISKNKYESFYNTIKDKLCFQLLNKNLIDDKIFNLCIKILNDVFNFYISGYPDIPMNFYLMKMTTIKLPFFYLSKSSLSLFFMYLLF